MVERLVAVDWSGDKGPGQRKKIWAGVWTRGRARNRVTLESGRNREELVEWLVEMARETPRMVVGVDFAFSYPAWFLRELGCKTVFDFWALVVATEGERWLHTDCDDGRFWGRKGAFRTGKMPPDFAGDLRHRMFRRADEECKVKGKILDPLEAAKVKGIAPKSPFQIGGAGAVGTGTLRGIPILPKLREAGFAVWPFEAPRLPMVVEIYPRLLTGEVKKSRAEGRAAYLDALLAGEEGYRSLEKDIVEKARGSEDAFDALVSAMVMAKHRDDFLTLRQAEDEIGKLEGAVWGCKRADRSEE
jgi:hypothetical protein